MDIILVGASTKQHDTRLRQLCFAKMPTNQSQPTKFQFMKQELKYSGNTLSVDGIKPDSAEVEAIQKFPTPYNKVGVLLTLGLVTYLPYKSSTQPSKQSSTTTKPSSQRSDFDMISQLNTHTGY